MRILQQQNGANTYRGQLQMLPILLAQRAEAPPAAAGHAASLQACQEVSTGKSKRHGK